VVTAVRWTLPAALIATLCGLLPAGAAAAQVGGGRALAPSLRKLTKPSVRTLPRSAQARRLGIAASGPGSLVREDGRVLVEAQFEGGAISQLSALRAAGARIVAASQPYQQVTASVPLTDLRDLATVPGLTSVRPVRAPVLRAPPEPSCRGAVVTEGISQLRVEPAREKLNEQLSEAPKEGEGLTVGVLSDSYNQATEAVSGGPIATKAPDDVTTQDLPGIENSCAGETTPVLALKPYNFVEGLEPPFDEGRAMLQIVHDIVPKAKLAFTSAFNGELAFAEGIEKLAAPEGEGGAEADVIVDDVGYFEEPFFQDGPVAVAIEKVVGEGVTYLTAAGNDNLFDSEKHEIASWEAPEFRDSGSCPAAVRMLSGLNGSHCMDFNPEPGAAVDRTFGLKVEPGEVLSVDLQWAEPWKDVHTNLDAYLLDAEGRLLTLATERNLETQRPAEILQWENESGAEKTVQLVINRRSGLSSPRLKFILLENGRGVSATEYPRSGGGDVVGPTVYGHAGAAAAITLGAVRFNKASEEPEPYSSRGPVTHYFGPYQGSIPAPPLLPPEVLSKPDAAATDCGRTTFFAAQSLPGIWRFCGTSAAAPHAAGLAAMAIEASKISGGTPTPAGVAEALIGTGVPVGPLGAFGPCAVGGGLLEAEGVVQVMRGLATPATPATCEAPASGGSVFVAPGSWGLEAPPTPEPEPEKPVTPITPTNPTNPPPIQPPEEAKPVPATKILTRPKKTVRTSKALARVVFRFGSEPGGAIFRCQYDGSPWRSCSATVARWFGLGPHVVRVQAKLGGVFDPTPVVYRFRIVRNR
jgi:hypothetical protein